MIITDKHMVALALMSIYYTKPEDFAKAAYDKVSIWYEGGEITELERDEFYEIIARYLWSKL